MNDSELQQRLARLPRTIEPPGKLWDGIAAGLDQRAALPQRRRWQPIAMAAAMALAVGVALWSRTGLAPDELIAEPGTDRIAGQGQLYANSVELSYSGALRALASEGADPAPVLDTGELELSLRAIRHATEEIREALAQDPDSIYLAELLESTHRKRVQLLRTFAFSGLDAENGRRT